MGTVAARGRHSVRSTPADLHPTSDKVVTGGNELPAVRQFNVAMLGAAHPALGVILVKVQAVEIAVGHDPGVVDRRDRDAPQPSSLTCPRRQTDPTTAPITKALKPIKPTSSACTRRSCQITNVAAVVTRGRLSTRNEMPAGARGVDRDADIRSGVSVVGEQTRCIASAVPEHPTANASVSERPA